MFPIEPGTSPTNDFVPLEPETHLHDMRVGPCKCGAWHKADKVVTDDRQRLDRCTICKADFTLCLETEMGAMCRECFAVKALGVILILDSMHDVRRCATAALKKLRAATPGATDGA